MGREIPLSPDVEGWKRICYPSHIATQMTSLFGELHGGKVFAQLGVDDFARRTAEFLGELNAIHPFREGNGRSQLAFIGLIGAAYGRIFQFQRLRREAFLPAMVASYFRDSRPLIEALRELLDEE